MKQMTPNMFKELSRHNIYLLHSIYLSIISYFNIITFITYKQPYDVTNVSYIICVYISIVFMLVDILICASYNSTSFIVYNVIYLTCVLNTIFIYGNLLSIIIFLFESTNISFDWFFLNILLERERSGNTKGNNTDTQIKRLLSSGVFIGYIFINKVIITPTVIMILYYSISSNIIQPLFMITFSFYVTNIIKVVNILGS